MSIISFKMLSLGGLERKYPKGPDCLRYIIEYFFDASGLSAANVVVISKLGSSILLDTDSNEHLLERCYSGADLVGGWGGAMAPQMIRVLVKIFAVYR